MILRRGGVDRDKQDLVDRPAIPDSLVSLPYSNESKLGTSALVNQFHENNSYYGDDLTWKRGRHNTKFGVQILRYQQSSFYPGNAGTLGGFEFTGIYTADPKFAQPGYGIADWGVGSVR